MLTKYGALEILDKMAFFQGQRAGRELWAEKSTEIQDIDIDCFVRDISNLREYIQTADVAPRAEVAREIFEKMDEIMLPLLHEVSQVYIYVKLKRKYTQSEPPEGDES